ncbi:hypothetical protein OAB00_01405 [Akkermansiaceae bacterium]|nr:hypothetical protein [Akkermansiaceae bacterium]
MTRDFIEDLLKQADDEGNGVFIITSIDNTLSIDWVNLKKMTPKEDLNYTELLVRVNEILNEPV